MSSVWITAAYSKLHSSKLLRSYCYNWCHFHIDYTNTNKSPESELSVVQNLNTILFPCFWLIECDKHPPTTVCMHMCPLAMFLQCFDKCHTIPWGGVGDFSEEVELCFCHRSWGRELLRRESSLWLGTAVAVTVHFVEKGTFIYCIYKVHLGFFVMLSCPKKFTTWPNVCTQCYNDSLFVQKSYQILILCPQSKLRWKQPCKKRKYLTVSSFRQVKLSKPLLRKSKARVKDLQRRK